MQWRAGREQALHPLAHGSASHPQRGGGGWSGEAQDGAGGGLRGAVAGRPVIGGEFDEPSQLAVGFTEHGYERKRPVENGGTGEEVVVTAVEVRPLMGDDRGEFGGWQRP